MWTPERDLNTAMVKHLATLSDLHRGGAEFLLIETQVAHTFLDVAVTTCDHERARLNVGHAREALDTIDRYNTKLNLEPRLRRAIDAHRKQLRLRLAAAERQFGAQFESGAITDA